MPPALMGTSDGDASGVSRVQIDAQGLLKVLHLLHIGRAPGGGGSGGGGGGGAHGFPRGAFGSTVDSLADPPASFPGAYSADGGASQHGSVIVPVTFILFPEDAANDGSAGEDAADADAEPQESGRASPELGDGARLR
jgi:hypothetical protein